MSAKGVISVSNIMFIIAGLYFILLAALGESSIYGVIATLFCLVSVAVDFKKDLFFSGPWRVATAIFIIVLTSAQLISLFMTSTASAIAIESILVNGVVFVLFLGVLLATARDITKKAADSDENEPTKEAKKLTYEI